MNVCVCVRVHAGSIPQGVADTCQVASTSQQGGAFQLTPATPSLQLCVCTTCEGEACVSLFWQSSKSSSSTPCPYRPPLHFKKEVTTFFKFPGDTAQQPATAGLQGGNWCRFKTARTTTWVVGYVREGACQGSNGEVSTTFDTFCPFLVNSCNGACNVKGLVNPTTRTPCSCDYWCPLYGDCCGPTNSNAASQCPTMEPSVDFATTRSCPKRTGLASQQAACDTFRPAGECRNIRLMLLATDVP